MKLNIKGVQTIENSSFEFPDSGLALIYGDNAVGKSSLIRAIAAAIAYDSSNRDSRISEEQKLLGILQDGSKANAGLISAGLDEAQINISSNLINEEVLISRNGKFKGSNPRFVITNVLSDVSWIMRILTHTTSVKVSDYLKDFNDMIKRYEDVIDGVTETKRDLFQKIQELNRMIRESTESQKKIKESRKLLENAKEELKAIQEKISEEAKNDPNREERISEINSQIREKEKSINKSSSKITEYEKLIRTYNDRIEQTRDQIKQRELKIKESTETLEEYEKADINSIPEIDEKISSLKDMRSKEQILYDILRRTYSMLEREHSGEVVCPLCGSNKINPAEVEKISKEKDEAIRRFDSQISVLSRKAGDLKEISKRKEEITKSIYSFTQNNVRDEDDLRNLKQDLDDTLAQLESEENKKLEFSKQRDNLQLAISEGYSDRLKSVQGRIKNIETEIKDLEMSRKYTQINIFGMNYPVETKTVDIFDKGVMLSLSDIEDHFQKLRETEQTKLKEEFNKNIKKILKEMSFDLDIYVDNNFNIIARKKTASGFEILETQNLSRSEQATIALTLQLALAQGYSPEMPIILCDGIYEYFDDERRKKILAYVDEFGKKYDKAILMTVVKEGVRHPTVGIA
jgi:DNA repair exonuclease SbcCD ATPase subunit